MSQNKTNLDKFDEQQFESQIGSRVILNPDFYQANSQTVDECLMGTVKRLDLEEKTVVVVWDNGKIAKYRYAKNSPLLIVQNDYGGIFEENLSCLKCFTKIRGVWWRNVKFISLSLCSNCYHGDEQDLEQFYIRKSSLNSIGERVEPRRNSRKIKLKGFFPGAKVVRGADWKWHEQDGGIGGSGEILELIDFDDLSFSGMSVQWAKDADLQNHYRIGFEGQIDLKGITATYGPEVYVDHLPIFGESTFQRLKRTILNQKKNQCFAYFLHRGVMENNIDFLKTLLDYGGDELASETHDQTALHTAAILGHKEIVELLLQRGLDLKSKNIEGETALHDAIQYQQNIIVSIMLHTESEFERSDWDSYMISACKWNNLEAFKLILEPLSKTTYFAEVIMKTLEFAIKNNLKKAVECLIKIKNVNFDFQNKYMMSPLNCAFFWKRYDIAKLLIQEKRDVNLVDMNGNTALHQCLSQYHSCVLDLSKVPTNRNDSDTRIARRKVEIEKLKRIAVRLILNGADVCLKNKNDKTPLDCGHDDQLMYELHVIIQKKFEKLNSNLENMKQFMDCSICLDQPRKIVFQCGHSFCRACSEKLTHCSLCRVRIDSKIEFF